MKYTWPLIDAKNELKEAYGFYRALAMRDEDYSHTASKIFDLLEYIDMLIDDIHMCKRND